MLAYRYKCLVCGHESAPSGPNAATDTARQHTNWSYSDGKVHYTVVLNEHNIVVNAMPSIEAVENWRAFQRGMSSQLSYECSKCKNGIFCNTHKGVLKELNYN